MSQKLVPVRHAERPGRGYFLSTMRIEPASKRAIAFVDGQNLNNPQKQFVTTGFFDIPAAVEEAAKKCGG